MQIAHVKISGFRSIPFGASVIDGDKKGCEIDWEPDAFAISFPTLNDEDHDTLSDVPMMCAIMGRNSSGKSTVLLALQEFFNSATKLTKDQYHNLGTDSPIVVELTLSGEITDADAEALPADTIQIDPGTGRSQITIAKIWPFGSTRNYYLKRTDGTSRYLKIPPKMIAGPMSTLLPQYRLIPADHRPSDAAVPAKNDLINDLFRVMIENAAEESTLGRVNQLVRELNSLLARDEDDAEVLWPELGQLEEQLASHLRAVIPRSNRIRFDLSGTTPDVQAIFGKSKIKIDDGVEVPLDMHGLGMQRSFLVSVFRAWHEQRLAQRERLSLDESRSPIDYFFAFEEPEVFMHPHATRLLLKTLEKIAGYDQVAFTTHSTEFINRVPLGNIRTLTREPVVGKSAEVSRVLALSDSHLSGRERVKIQRHLLEDRSDMLFAKAVMLVEGQAELAALPLFAETLGVDFDELGISLVCVNGWYHFVNFSIVCQEFGIPHLILADGDGRMQFRGHQIATRCPKASQIVLEEDFEAEIAENIHIKRIVQIVNAAQTYIDEREVSAKNLTNIAHTKKTEFVKKNKDRDVEMVPQSVFLGQAMVDKPRNKPLIGRVLGEMLTNEEVNKLDKIVRAIELVQKLAS